MNKKIYLYSVNHDAVNWEEIKDFFVNKGFEVFLKNDPFLNLEGERLNKIAEYLAKIRVLHPLKKDLNDNPFPIEIDYEKRNLKREKRKKGIIYDAFKFLKIYHDFIPSELKDLNNGFPFFFTDQLIATFSDRWHLRVIILSFPVLISIPGIVHAPAKDRDYYIAETLKSVPEFKDYYLKENDKRLTKILCAYVIQGIFFYKSIIERKDFNFCDDKNCVLYNSHFQKEVISAQYNLNFCDKHRIEWEKFRQS